MRKIIAPALAAALVGAAALSTLPASATDQSVCSPAPASDADGAACKLADLLERNFINAAQGARYAAVLREGVRSGRYAKLPPTAAAAAMTREMQGTASDGHLRVRHGDGPAPRGAPPPQRQAPVLEQAGWIAPGIAYIRINAFPDDPAVTAQVAAFMQEHVRARALIFDLRTHRGGGIDQMDVILPWLFAKPTRLVTMETSWATEREWGSPVADHPSMHLLPDKDMARREHWVTPNADPRLRAVKVYLLTGPRTGSAAEHFALAMKITHRATLVGGATAGANHFGTDVELPGGFTAFLPIGRTYDPATGQDWEGAGVSPDIAVPPQAALERALSELGVAPGEAARLSSEHTPTLSMERKPAG